MHLETQYNFSREQLEAFAARVMYETVGYLATTKVIDDTTATEIIDSTTPVIVLRESILSHLLKKIFTTKAEPGMVDFKIKFVTFKPE